MGGVLDCTEGETRIRKNGMILLFDKLIDRLLVSLYDLNNNSFLPLTNFHVWHFNRLLMFWLLLV